MASTKKGLEKVAHRFFGGRGVTTTLGGSSGMSGSVFARVELRDEVWCLRGWPPDLSPERLRFMHRVLLRSRSEGFEGVPALAETSDGDTAVESGGRLFDAQEWVQGEPLYGRRDWGILLPNVALIVGPEKLYVLTRAMAAFHRSTEALRPDRPSEILTLQERLDAHAARASTKIEPLYEKVRANATGEELEISLRWLRLLPEAIDLAEDTVRRHPAGARAASTVCHGDLWAQHVHFTGPDFAGWTDFEGLHFGSASYDLAQLILHFAGWRSRYDVLHFYRKARSLDPEEEAVLPVAAAADLAFEGAWALARLYGESRPLSPDEKVAHHTNLRALLESLEMIVEELAKASDDL